MEISDLRQLQSDLYLLNEVEQNRVLQEYRISSLNGRSCELIIGKRIDIN